MPAWLVSWVLETVGGWFLGREADAVIEKVETENTSKPEPVEPPKPVK